MTPSELAYRVEKEMGIPVDAVTVSFTPKNDVSFQHRYFLHFGDVCGVGYTPEEAMQDAKNDLASEVPNA